MTPQLKYASEEREIVCRALVTMAQILVEHCGKNVIIDATGNRKEFRELARSLISEFAEIYVKCPLETCKAREASRWGQPVQKNPHKRASGGEVKGELPAIYASYEKPGSPEVPIASDVLSSYESAKRIKDYVMSRWT
jgi:adenylylsulfate kinase